MRRRQRQGLPEASKELKESVLEAVKRVLPKGFDAELVDAARPGHVRLRIMGPCTRGHRDGILEWSWPVTTKPVTPSILDGFKRACKAWAKEPRLKGGGGHGKA